jgi:hypothetical protein
MNRNTIFSVTQSIIIVAVCAALGLSLAKVSGGAGVSPLLSVIGGTVFGLIGICVGFMVRSPKPDSERYSGAMVGFRIMMVGFILAIAGWLVGVFLSQAIGYWFVAVGVLTGCAGIAVVRFQSSTRV